MSEHSSWAVLLRGVGSLRIEFGSQLGEQIIESLVPLGDEHELIHALHSQDGENQVEEV